MADAHGSGGDVQAARVVVVSTPGCPYCKRAKEALADAKIAYVDVDVSHDEELRAAVREASGSRTVPQIFVDGASIGGSDALLPLLADGNFQARLQAAKGPGLPAGLAAKAVAVLQREQANRAAQAPANVAATRLEELARRLADPAAGVPRTKLTSGARTIPSFTAGELIAWLTSNDPPGTPSGGPSPAPADAPSATAAATAQALLEANLVAVISEQPLPDAAARISPVAASTGGSGAGSKLEPALKYALVSELPAPEKGRALNTAYWWYGPARPATQVATDLRQLILELYDSHLAKDGRGVSYRGIARDPLFARYVALTAELQKVDLSGLDRATLMALFINLYNALIIHAMVVHGTKMNAVQRAQFFTGVAKYNIGGHDYTADDMENGVLRGNRAPASALLVLVGLPQFAPGPFKKGDPRATHLVQPVDPRIHFALVCGAKSCPPIKLYTPDNLGEGLAAAAEAFCQSEVAVDEAKREVQVSKIFKWYSIDFGSNKRERLQTISQWLAPGVRQKLEALLADGRDVTLSYKEYDWGVNDTDA